MPSYDQFRRSLRIDLIVGLRIKQWERKLEENFKSAAKHNGRMLIYAGEEAVMDAVYRKDIMFLDGLFDDCVGISKLKRTDSYRFLKQVEAGNTAEAVTQLIGSNVERLKDTNFFKFSLRDDRSYFVTPAHVANTPKMVATLGSLGVDFNEPDSEGRLPLFFIARYAKSRWVIPTLCKIFNASANESGQLPKYIPMPALLQDEEDEADVPSSLHAQIEELQSFGKKAEHYADKPAPTIWDPPLVRAIKYRNRESLLGFDLLPSGAVDWNKRFQWNHMTPLIYAVLRADQIVTSYQKWHEECTQHDNWLDAPRPEYLRRDAVQALWIVKFLAAHSQVDPKIRDSTGSDAEGYAYTDPVKKALQKGLNARNQTKNYTQPIPR